MTNNEKKAVLKDALDDFIKVLNTFNEAYNNMCSWYEAYGRPSMWRSSDMQFKHDLDDEDIEWFSADDIWQSVIDVLKIDFEDHEWPYEFRPDISFDETPNSARIVRESYNEIIDDLNKKLVNEVEPNERFMNLDIE